MSPNLRAVPWFAEMEPWGGELGGVVVEEGSGDMKTSPKGAKAEVVSGTALAVMTEEVAIAEVIRAVWTRCTLVVDLLPYDTNSCVINS